ncbi:hypothetical protein EVAR_47470_1 [Eumeta japonica]|uniref:Uncharacterized protein n=1 Tax=Eumeta variegata TaxID=151549 RepID=A0A4C1XCQ6_EUMVA|nr:hypothetical protein EVAR_47470_1 [Eumeta japonica]
MMLNWANSAPVEFSRQQTKLSRNVRTSDAESAYIPASNKSAGRGAELISRAETTFKSRAGVEGPLRALKNSKGDPAILISRTVLTSPDPREINIRLGNPLRRPFRRNVTERKRFVPLNPGGLPRRRRWPRRRRTRALSAHRRFYFNALRPSRGAMACEVIGPRETPPGAEMFHNLIWDLGICSIELYNLCVTPAPAGRRAPAPRKLNIAPRHRGLSFAHKMPDAGASEYNTGCMRWLEPKCRKHA